MNLIVKVSTPIMSFDLLGELIGEDPMPKILRMQKNLRGKLKIKPTERVNRI